MDWQGLLTAVVAGGLGGQIITVFWRAQLTAKNEIAKWRVEERYKLYSQLLTLVTYSPKDEAKLKSWTYEIRDLSLRLHILFDGGTAPKELADAIEQVFQLARDKKRGDDGEQWSLSMREAVRNMRKSMSNNIH